MTRIAVALFCLLAGLTQAAASEEGALKSLVTANDSKGWEAVGRIEIANSGFCTGALIRENVVLTAAHCLFNSRTLERVNDRDIEFLAGWRNGRAAAYRNVKRAILHPDYKYTGPESGDGVPNDIAVLELDRPIRNGSITPFAIHDRPRKGDEVGVVSYAHDRSARPSLQEVCHVLARPTRTLVLSCDVDYGSSGAPIFVMEDGEPQIVSVVSAKAEVRGRQVSLGAGIESGLDLLLTELDEGALPVAEAPVVRRLTIEPRQGSGAKFLRP